MDGFRFDTLTRSLTLAGSRRRALAGLFAGALELLSSQTEQAAAKNCKKIKNKQKRKKCLAKAKTRSPTPACTPQCADKHCGRDGGGASCGNCPAAGQRCTAAGQCACPEGAPQVCGGACLPACPRGYERDPGCTCC